MKKKCFWMTGLCAVSALVISGCSAGNLGGDLIKEVTPTPVPVPTATPVPTPTVTPVPVNTATPAPWRIGTKTSLSSYLYLNNNLNDKVREMYLMAYGGYEWGKNIIPSEATIKAFEKVQFCYTPMTAEDGSEVTLYSMKFVTQSGKVYQLDQIPLQDMQQAVLRVDDGLVSLHYTSLSDNTEKVIPGSDADLGYSGWSESEEDYDSQENYDSQNSYYPEEDYDYNNDYEEQEYYEEPSYDEDYDVQYDDYDYSEETYQEETYEYDDQEYN